MPICIEVSGDYACFSRPEMKVERVSYDVMTPSAARGIIEAVMWHPGMRYIIDKIHVCAPIRFTNIRRNEVKDVISARNVKAEMNSRSGDLYIAASESIQQRAAMVLKDVHYVIEAHFEMTEKAVPSDNPGKFCDMLRRRVEKGQCYHQPSEPANSLQKWKNAPKCRPVRRSLKVNGISAGCFWIWIIRIRKTSSLCSSAQSLLTAC